VNGRSKANADGSDVRRNRRGQDPPLREIGLSCSVVACLQRFGRMWESHMRSILHERSRRGQDPPLQRVRWIGKRLRPVMQMPIYCFYLPCALASVILRRARL